MIRTAGSSTGRSLTTVSLGASAPITPLVVMLLAPSPVALSGVASILLETIDGAGSLRLAAGERGQRSLQNVGEDPRAGTHQRDQLGDGRGLTGLDLVRVVRDKAHQRERK